ncbi:MAG TPA: ferrochelatase [Zoogloea sp.]|uniref:ferrochelatase n=1 Tax=Zoogloea sp. TaxID=49181 RepID=UPI002B5F0AC7|nr:ferrochelatase [Zoogloea sp.]HMV17812.1 ferrochelatase [Rhodocyclaceae bacterium]HMV61687.1 ferrochelatase [Rhodocyclaceae bacterium]HMW53053.1 ferrochelatase [Rhodocyclaceae bacterium]HMY48072.1 ferrochelatase [Rhodocyclaceae bacterium]HMZ74619.1 ferrochelatase [Rhodocyclaceae bacterium]
MTRFWQEPPFRHGSPSRTGILIVNLGTPAAPTADALRPYLREFLSDPRVVEIPRPIWWLILNGIILNTRPAKSARKYASVWTDEGSPLKVHTERQAKLLAGFFVADGAPDLVVNWAMRYGQPSVRSRLDEMRAQGCTRVLVIPMYPQYAASTTASVLDAVGDCLQHWRNLPEIRYVRSFADDPGYIGALAASVREHWQRNGQAEKLVLSFHGIPRRSLDLGDPYHCECHKTARLLGEALKLPAERLVISFQSRFGRAKWLEPYTQATLEALARDGVTSVDVMCPGFTADCLETLEEINMECRDAFLAAGGKAFGYIPCLNERDDWIRALRTIARRHLGHWLDLPAEDPARLAASAERARQLGATI